MPFSENGNASMAQMAQNTNVDRHESFANLM